MSVGDMLAYVWSLLQTAGFRVFDVFVSFADVFIFTIVAGLFIWLLYNLLGGGD